MAKRIRILACLVLFISCLHILSFFGYCELLIYNIHAGDKWVERHLIRAQIERNMGSYSRKLSTEAVGIVTYRIDSVNPDGSFRITVFTKLISHKTFVDNKQVKENPEPIPPKVFRLSKSGRLVKMESQLNIGDLGSALPRFPVEFADKNVSIGEPWKLSTTAFIEAGLPPSSMKKAVGRILSIKSSPHNNNKFAEVETTYEFLIVLPQDTAGRGLRYNFLFRMTRLIDIETGIPYEGDSIVEVNFPEKTQSGYAQVSMKGSTKIESMKNQR